MGYGYTFRAGAVLVAIEIRSIRPFRASIVAHAMARTFISLALLAWAAIGVAASNGRMADDLTNAKNRPVTKVITLLKDMLKQLEKEATDDEDIYEKMSCWCTTNDKEKTKAILGPFWIHFRTILGPPMQKQNVFLPHIHFLEMAHTIFLLYSKNTISAP